MRSTNTSLRPDAIAANRSICTIATCAMFAMLCFGPAFGQTRERDEPLFHLDAERLHDELASREQSPAEASEAIWDWPSGSGSNRVVFRAEHETSRPTLVAIGQRHVVRFDGNDDALRFRSPWQERSKITIWLVVAPHHNGGDFRGLISSNAPGQRDYVSGLNVDLGPGPGRRWDVVNIEGRGFSGAQDLFEKQVPFASLHILQVVVDAPSNTVSVSFDGDAPLTRPMRSESISVHEWTLGARYYTNGPGDQQVRGSFHGDIAEVLVYDRLMDEEESKLMFDRLQAKHAALASELPRSVQSPSTSDLLIPFENPPPVQMLVPGFDVQRIPLELTNVNNVRYRHDGALITLGYNGDIHILRDTDGDGLEDSKSLYYKNTHSLRGPIGMQWTSRDDPRGQGCFVASKGKISFLIDLDGDDRADEERIVAQGWEEIPQNVDAVGIAVDRDGSVYFGLGAANYANAYLVDDRGNAKYDLKSDRGTIQRVSPDFSTRETVCTGIRFPIGLEFNADGDLFCTDQEGATWLANGNPFDELLHIRSGKHYGFPPRHPMHNPSVIDEPSVFDYGPQHQSTCGMFFNANALSPSHVGPEYWAGDAIVTGESRGKLYRTQLVKSEHGYIAKTHVLGCLQMLTIDVCATPQGGMVVACHSGPPDWGTGPAGIGELFKIVPVQGDTPLPRPTMSWFSAPGEIAIAFDAPLDPEDVRHWQQAVDVYAGPNVRAGDRYENLIPPYAVVKSQSMTPRRRIDVSGLGLTPDHRTLMMRIPPQSRDEHYAVRMPTPFARSSPTRLSGKWIEQRQEMEIDLSPRGVRASWITDSDPTVTWTGILPHWDVRTARQLAQGSAEHERLWQAMQRPGTLRLHTRLDLADVLRPKVQLGASIDYPWPAENVSVMVRGALRDLDVGMADAKPVPVRLHQQDSASQGERIRFLGEPTASRTVELIATYRIDGWDGNLPSIAFHTDEDTADRAIPIHRFQMPDFEQGDAPKYDGSTVLDDRLQGGNWGRGRLVFRGGKARCSVCHNEPGFGATLIGPDLSNLVHRDHDSVLRDIVHPSYAINPEYVGQKIRLTDGTVLTGVLRDRDGALLLGDSEGKTLSIDKDFIEEISPSATSTMPTGLLDALSEQERIDLLSYLLRPAPSMPLDRSDQAPPLRTAAEVARVLDGSVVDPSIYRPLRMVLVAGPKDHGPDEHDYPAWMIQWGQLLAAADDVAIDTAWEFPNDEQLAHSDVLVFFQKGDWDRNRAQAMDAFFQRGGGALYLHWAVNGNDSAPDFAKRIGIASRGGQIRFRHGPLALRIDNNRHPIVRNIDRLDLLDESYWLMSQSELPIDILASSEEDGNFHPQLWTAEPGAGRVLVSIPGHYSWTFDDPIFRIVLLRGIAWIAREPIDRFNDLVPLGARMSK